MMNTLTQILRLFLFLGLGLAGMVMAMIFMVSTAIAIGVLYVVARARGRPFGARAYWAQRQTGFRTRAGAPPREPEVIDVEAREIS
ncbi:MAG: hypothetical protein WCY98_04800 [Castellaniella sp.]